MKWRSPFDYAWTITMPDGTIGQVSQVNAEAWKWTYHGLTALDDEAGVEPTCVAAQNRVVRAAFQQGSIENVTVVEAEELSDT
jgi:hypothetical protein